MPKRTFEEEMRHQREQRTHDARLALQIVEVALENSVAYNALLDRSAKERDKMAVAGAVMRLRVRGTQDPEALRYAESYCVRAIESKERETRGLRHAIRHCREGVYDLLRHMTDSEDNLQECAAKLMGEHSQSFAYSLMTRNVAGKGR